MTHWRVLQVSFCLLYSRQNTLEACNLEPPTGTHKNSFKKKPIVPSHRTRKRVNQQNKKPSSDSYPSLFKYQLKNDSALQFAQLSTISVSMNAELVFHPTTPIHRSGNAPVPWHSSGNRPSWKLSSSFDIQHYEAVALVPCHGSADRAGWGADFPSPS